MSCAGDLFFILLMIAVRLAIFGMVCLWLDTKVMGLTARIEALLHDHLSRVNISRHGGPKSLSLFGMLMSSGCIHEALRK